ncbi:hypothetical protein NEOLEDRAFT_1186977 [Neolentinus lepideus HHB14362 ss-1]|uniref:Uncharacterized protein n=1 Tax=Neolentinus lepideus HHB14362 ss-1 TaxID=1314782 RepID=A0A165W7P0_9AGAM|nr:hypothetical protein NEOLEDRAFT_1186977 [Neolentinus lepideus HHB14362 ss-1]
MSSFLSAVLGCCLRAKSTSPERPDETTHLIPAARDVDVPPQRPHVVVVDPQKMKERLQTIVRSKEGKMVNVHLSAPFNVHNRVLPNGQSSTSRSTRYPSPQPSLQTSRSTTSLQQDGAMAHEAGAGEEENGYVRSTLNVRLVKTAGPVNRSRPGSRSRLGRSGEERRAENGSGGDAGNENENGGEGGEVAAESGPESGQEGENAGVRVCGSRSSDTCISPCDDSKGPTPTQPQRKQTSSIQRGFKIQITSALSRSWGD